MRIKRSTCHSSALGTILDESSSSENENKAPLRYKSQTVKVLGKIEKGTVVDRSKDTFYYKLDGLTKKVREYVRLFGSKVNIQQMKRIRSHFRKTRKTFMDQVCTDADLGDLRKMLHKIEMKKKHRRHLEREIIKDRKAYRLKELKDLIQTDEQSLSMDSEYRDKMDKDLTTNSHFFNITPITSMSNYRMGSKSQSKEASLSYNQLLHSVFAKTSGYRIYF